MHRLLRAGTLLAVGAALVALTMWAHAEASYRRAGLRPEADLLVLPRPEVLRVTALGHTELVADLVWVRAVVYAGGEIAHRGDLRWLDRYLDTIVELDPTFRRPYKWAGVVTMYNGKIITNQMVRQSSHYLELATQRFPRDWEFPFMLGCNYLNELQSTDPKQKAEWRRIAGDYIQRAAVIGGGPPWLPILAATIYTREGETDLAIRHLEEVYASSEDPRVRAEVKAKLAQLHQQVDTERLEQARSALVEAWRAWAPYTPLDLFVLAGQGRADQTRKQLTAQPRLGGLEEAEPPER
ncbi:MAG TPA: hypothetical protein VKN99_03560 [Polyangia bacterium]|nr:hypothetical protein [Polyangia bacterium]